MSRELGESNAGVEKLRRAMRKIVEVINSERQQHRETAKIVSRNERAAVETEISNNGKFEKVASEIVELRRDVIEGIAHARASSGAKGSGEDERQGDETGGGQMVLYRKLGNLESRLDANESANQRQDATLQGHIAELKWEIGDLKTLCRASRDSGRGAQRSRSTSIEPNGWTEKLDGIRQNVDEVSASTGKTREDTRRPAERIESITRENTQLREDVETAYLAIKRVDIAMADMTRENGRLKDRIVDLVGLNEESQKRMTLFEEVISGLRREMTDLAARTNENKDDVRIVKATLAASPSAPPGMALLRKGIEEDEAVSEAAASTIPAAPAMQGKGHRPEAHLGRPRPRVRMAVPSRKDKTDQGVETLSQPRREQCDLCGDYADERGMHPCPRCRSRICITCSPGFGVCLVCDGDARYERASEAQGLHSRVVNGGLVQLLLDLRHRCQCRLAPWPPFIMTWQTGVNPPVIWPVHGQAFCPVWTSTVLIGRRHGGQASGCRGRRVSTPS